METNVIYQKLSPSESRDLGLEAQSSQKSEAFVKSFLRRCVPSLENVDEFLGRKALALEHEQKKKTRKRHKAKGFTAKERRELKLFRINPDQQRYHMYLPLHQLWKQYVRDLCNGLRPGTQTQMIQSKILKADLHGAAVTVFKSKCPSYVGLAGIILQESKHVFKIITEEDKLKVVPKLNCVFSVEIDGFITYIYGSKLQMRASERSAKKFKAKGSIDL
ncbi:ribonuclease P protein subunit p29 isoform X1 [Ranitomeya variabilis]|uniref:ribonuclease P protein subunit p29 isoform X1 n=1 Tax=Ranitomeya variabilis TaxID=490064 RepID=UPI0040561FCA